MNGSTTGNGADRSIAAYSPGDTVVGRFSCTDRRMREKAVVTARIVDPDRGPGFIGRNPHPKFNLGSGVWGYDDEIAEVIRADA